MFSRFLFVLPLLSLMSLAFAQPPDVPSTIKNPATAQAMGMPAPPPDPPLISSQELQKLTGGPTLVTLSGVDLPTKDVLKALLEAAKLPENLDFPPDRRTVSVDWKQTPFWVAAAEMETLTGSTWSADYGNGLSLMNFGRSESRGLNGKPVAQHPFLSLLANSISRTSTQTVSLAPRPLGPNANLRTKSEQLQLSLSAYLDPKLPLQSLTLRSISFQKKGEAAPAPEPNNRFFHDYGRNRGPVSWLSFPLPQDTLPGTTFSRISGVVHTTLATTTEAFQLPGLAAVGKTTKEIGGNRYTVESVAVDANQITVNASAAAGENQDLPNNLLSMLRVRDAQGKELRSGGSSYSSSNKSVKGNISFSLRNNRGEIAPGPYSLEWKIVTETRSLDVPFELRDIVVP